MNANRILIAVSTLAVTLASLSVSSSAVAEDRHTFRRSDHPAASVRHTAPAPVVRHADFRRERLQRAAPEPRHFHARPPVVVHKPVVVHRPVIVQRPVIVERPVYVQRTVVVERPAPVYYAPPPVYAEAPPYYGEPRAEYYDPDPNPAGAIAGAVIGGVIGSQIGDHDSRGLTTLMGAVFGGLIGGGF